MGRHREAIPHLAEAVRLDPGYAQARYQLGMAQALTGDHDAAREQRAALRKLDPNLANLLGMLIR
ncbi:MAG: tetratricopeptide repeat protein [Planctomycetota bacterium]